MHRVLSIPLLSFMCQSVVAKEDWQTWGAVIATGALAEPHHNVEYWLEGQGRFNDDSSRFNQGIVRAALGYRVAERAVLWMGYGYIPNDPPQQRDNVIEHRIFQQLTWSCAEPLLGFSLASRSRVEQRTIEGADDTGWRLRQFVKLTRPFAQHPRWYWSLWDELFLNLNDTDWGADGGIDQNRVFAGVGYRLAPNARAEVGYMNQLVRREQRDDASNHITSLTVLLRF